MGGGGDDAERGNAEAAVKTGESFNGGVLGDMVGESLGLEAEVGDEAAAAIFVGLGLRGGIGAGLAIFILASPNDKSG